jgi:acyl carrier protein
MSEIEQKVKSIVAKQLNVQDEIKSENSFVDDLGADSLDVVELVMAFEEEFGIDIPDDKAETIKTVADAVKYIQDNK